MVSKKVRSIMREKHITNIELANHLGILPQSLNNKFFRDTFSVKELITILNYLDCNLVIESKPDTRITLTLDD